MKLLPQFLNGFFKENPVFVIVLGMCPTLATTSSLEKAIGMGLASTFVLVCSNLIISSIKKYVPDEVRIPIFIVVIATFVTLVKLLMAAYFPDLKAALGIFLPLIVVNCIILGRAEAFASKNGVLESVADGLGMGVGFTLALALLGSVREILGSGSLLGIPFFDGVSAYTQTIFILAPGGFITLGLFMGFFNYLALRKHRYAKAGGDDEK
ncbi:MAG: electron transport complex subunit E [Planctomycetota bacterium]|jgi:electron transport complex protein RnfE|nr:electron transport complex subunit E [Planctomycetota bacterium]